MRREKEKNRKLVFIIILAGISTLLSFFFDQQVIQSENDIRDFEYQLNQKRTKVSNLQNTINSIENINFDILNSINFYKNKLDFFYLRISTLNTQIQGIEDEKIDFYNIDEKKILDYREYLINEILKNLDNYDDKISQFKIINRYIITNQTVQNILDSNQGFEIIRSNFDKYKANDKFNNFPFYFYLSNEELFNMTEEEFQNLSDYQIYKSVRDPMGEFDDIEFEYLDLLQRVKVYYNNNFLNFYKSLEYYADKKNTKNIFILLSIFFQILSLTILLILFKEMLKK